MTSDGVARICCSRGKGILSLGMGNGLNNVLGFCSSCCLRVCDGGESMVGLGDGGSAGLCSLRSR
jgi:hypothetical protein